MNGHGLKRAEARTLIQRHVGTLWCLDPAIARRGNPVCVVPAAVSREGAAARMQGSETPHLTWPFEGAISAEQVQSGRQESTYEKPASTATLRSVVSLPGDSISPPLACPPDEEHGCPGEAGVEVFEL